MTTRPKLRLGKMLLPGVLAIALFGMMAAIVLNTAFADTMQGFPEGISITSEIGYAMFDLSPLQSGEGALANTEPFLVSFLLIAIVLDAALDAALVLAKREDEGQAVAPLASTSADSSAGPGAGARRSASSTGPGSNAATDGGTQFRSGSSTGTDRDDPAADGGENA